DQQSPVFVILPKVYRAIYRGDAMRTDKPTDRSVEQHRRRLIVVNTLEESDTTHPQATLLDFVVVDKSRNPAQGLSGNIQCYPTFCFAVTKVWIDGWVEDTSDLAVYGRDPVRIVMIDNIRNPNEVPFQCGAGDFDHLDRRIVFPF